MHGRRIPSLHVVSQYVPLPLKEICGPNTAAGGPYDCWKPPRPVRTRNQRPSRIAQLGPKSDIPPRAPAPPRLPPKLPPRPRGAPRKDILTLTIFFWVKYLFFFSLSVPCTAKPLI